MQGQISEHSVSAIQRLADQLTAGVETVIEGKSEAISSIIIALLSGGHVLIEDVPGVGKTMLAKSLAAALGATTHRVQFTPDLLPSDITGSSVFNQATREFEFRPGAVFTTILLADEINRASPKTQSALLEAMEEGSVSVDGTTHALPSPFMVLATANPIEMDGTFALPEAQRDRFLMRLSLGYPEAEAEVRMLSAQATTGPTAASRPLDAVHRVARIEDITQAAFLIGHTYAAPEALRYVVALADATRRHPGLILGASPRAAVHLVRAAKTQAVLSGRTFMTPQDVHAMIEPVWGHRLIAASGHTRAADADEQALSILREIVADVPVTGPAA